MTAVARGFGLVYGAAHRSRDKKDTAVIPSIKQAVVSGFLLATGATPVAADVATRPFNPVGEWQAYHSDGKPFRMHLRADKTAETDFGAGEQGIWRWEGETVRVLFTDGWDDVIERHDGGLRKRSWEPGADRCGPPTNTGPVESLSD